MSMNKFKALTFLLLLSMSFSVTHGVFFAVYDSEHTEIHEHVSELTEASGHQEMCDLHAQYHNLDTINLESVYIAEFKKLIANNINDEIYLFEHKMNFFRPPIS